MIIRYLIILATIITLSSQNLLSNSINNFYEQGLKAFGEKNYQESIENLKKALELDPQYINTYLALGLVYAKQKDYAKAAAISRQLLKVNPNQSEGLYNLAYALRKQNKKEESIMYYKKVLEIRPDFGAAHFGLEKSYLAIGDFENGWEHFEWRFQNNKAHREKFACHTIKPEDLRDKAIFIRFEPWGFGDFIQFIRYVQRVKSLHTQIFVETFKSLVNLMKQCDYIDVVLAKGEKPPAFDIQIPYLSLPLIFKTRYETIPADIPYLFADPKLVEYWQNTLKNDTNFKIGICWQAGPSQQRSIPLKLLSTLSQIENISFYSLQKFDGLDQLNNLPEGFVVHTFGNNFDTDNGRFMDTAAVIKNMDLIITVDTSITHLAGALGTPVWVMLLHVAEWRWMENKITTPWYPNMRLFRQKNNGNWSSVIEAIKEELMRITP